MYKVVIVALFQVENTIRWRRGKDEEGNEVKESNARVVKWSDGSMSLLLGAEVFDIHKTKIDGEHNHLFVQQVRVIYYKITIATCECYSQLTLLLRKEKTNICDKYELNTS